MVLSSLQTNFEAAAEQGSGKKRRLSANSPHRSTAEVLLLCRLPSWRVLFPKAGHPAFLLAVRPACQLLYRCSCCFCYRCSCLA